ncbi:MAG: hypothetical protein ACTSR8_02940 [Promethearchaeota archaeon]
MSIPVIVGAAQYKQPKKAENPLDPLRLMIKTGAEAINDSGNEDIKRQIDAVFMININSWSYEDAPGELSKALGIKPTEKVYLPDGGNTPQMLVNRAAKVISKGGKKAILIIGAEAAYSKLLSKKGKRELDWPELKDSKYMEGELWDGTTKFENKYKFKFPPNTYAIFETAVRADRKRTLEEHRKYMGKLFERYSAIASKNPFAWSNKALSADEITLPNPNNRPINHPYTKLMCSNMFVDQSAAVIITSEELATDLGINGEKWVYPMGGADLQNVHAVILRPNLYDSPASRAGSKLALKQAGITLNDINAFELYSCFPSIVEIMTKEIGISDDDPRDLTLTGGLPFFGGPWSNYSLHGIVSAIDYVRDHPNSNVMVVANGGYNTKQSFGIYGKKKPNISWTERDDSDLQKKILNDKKQYIEKADGMLTVEAYTMAYDRAGRPKEGIIVGSLEDGRRTIAFMHVSPEILTKIAEQELVGKQYRVKYDSKNDYNVIIFG